MPHIDQENNEYYLVTDTGTFMLKNEPLPGAFYRDPETSIVYLLEEDESGNWTLREIGENRIYAEEVDEHIDVANLSMEGQVFSAPASNTPFEFFELEFDEKGSVVGFKAALLEVQEDWGE
jgi:uncharacterized protein YuzE